MALSPQYMKHMADKSLSHCRDEDLENKLQLYAYMYVINFWENNLFDILKKFSTAEITNIWLNEFYGLYQEQIVGGEDKDEVIAIIDEFMTLFATDKQKLVEKIINIVKSDTALATVPYY